MASIIMVRCGTVRYNVAVFADDIERGSFAGNTGGSCSRKRTMEFVADRRKSASEAKRDGVRDVL